MKQETKSQMTPEQYEISQQVVDSPFFEWQDRMLAVSRPYTDVLPDTVGYMTANPTSGYYPGEGWYPDLTDPPTVGALINMLAKESKALVLSTNDRGTALVERNFDDKEWKPDLGTAVSLLLIELGESS